MFLDQALISFLLDLLTVHLEWLSHDSEDGIDDECTRKLLAFFKLVWEVLLDLRVDVEAL